MYVQEKMVMTVRYNQFHQIQVVIVKFINMSQPIKTPSIKIELLKKLNILAASVDIKRNDQLHKSIQIDIQNLNADIKFDLEEYGEVTL